MKICFVTESFYPEIDGGAVHSKLLAEKFHEMGHDVLIVTRRPNVSYPLDEIVSGFPVKRVGLDDRYGIIGRYLGILTILPPLINMRKKYDIVLIAAPRILGSSVVLLMKLLGKKCVIKPDSCGEMDGSYALCQISARSLKYKVAELYFWFRNHLLKQADAYVAISSVIVNEICALGIDKRLVRKIPNGVDIDKFRPLKVMEKGALRAEAGIPADDLVFSYCGRLTYDKGLKSLLRVWKTASESNKNIHLMLIGSGEGMSLDCEAELKEYVAANGLVTKVTFTGGVEDVTGYLGCADVFILPSLTEALGIALIEAQLTGIPAIATRVGGIPDVITDGANGILVAPECDKELLAAIEDLIGDREKLEIMGQSARKSAVDKFSISSVTESYISLLVAVERSDVLSNGV